MDIVPFVMLTVNTRFIQRWVVAGLLLLIPVFNFLSLGYLTKTSNLLMVGGIGLPTWDDRSEIWKDGAKLLYIFILYEALPSFLFSCGFFFASFGNLVTAFIGWILKWLAAVAFVGCSFFLPFGFCAFAENRDVRNAFEFEKILLAVKRVFPHYLLGFIVTAACLYVTYKLHRIPFLLGFILSSALTYYVFLIATFYFTQLFRKVSGSPATTGE
jgi:hypothetical protein